MSTLESLLRSRPYPGRGCVAARTTDGSLAFVYFLTGRSEASRSRALRRLPNADIAVANTAGASADDALRHYVGGAQRGSWVVVGNGDQVVPIAEGLADGGHPLQVWSQHTYEPDPPIFTSRIWLALDLSAQSCDCLVGYARRSTRGSGEVDRVVQSVGALGNGDGVIMTTYDGTVTEVRAARGPEDFVTSSATYGDLLAEVWSALDPQLRVGAFVVDPETFSTSFASLP